MKINQKKPNKFCKNPFPDFKAAKKRAPSSKICLCTIKYTIRSPMRAQCPGTPPNL